MHKEKALIEIRLAGLPQGASEFGFTCTAGDFGDPALTDAGFSKGISVKVIVEKLEDELIVIMNTAATADIACDLCLAPASVELAGSYRVCYGYEHRGESDEEQDEEYRIIDRNRLSIDLTEDVRETLLLSVPMKVTCTDNPDCGVFREEKQQHEADEDSQPDISWQESLDKLKNKYR